MRGLGTWNAEPTQPAVPKGRTTMWITSPAFEPDSRIPKKHAYRPEGANVSPPLAWSGAPEGTKELALVCDDPDAPSRANPRPEGPWVHWVVYRIPASQSMLAEGASGLTEGKNDFGETAWGGPLPPNGSGEHRYVFTIYALDHELDAGPGLTKAELLERIEGNVLAQGELIGTYERR